MSGDSAYLKPDVQLQLAAAQTCVQAGSNVVQHDCQADI